MFHSIIISRLGCKFYLAPVNNSAIKHYKKENTRRLPRVFINIFVLILLEIIFWQRRNHASRV